jgi:Arc/MetJ family transcription regulator
MYQDVYPVHMKTTINISDELLREAIKITGVKTKTEAIEIGLKEIIAMHNRKKLADLFGSQKNLVVSGRRRSR